MPIEEVLRERGKVHGKYADNAVYAQDLKSIVRASKGWQKLTNVQKDAIEAILNKIARILAGDSYFTDHWVDISGYSTLALNEIKEIEEENR